MDDAAIYCGEAAVNTGLYSPCVTSRSATSNSLSSPATATPCGLGRNDALTSKISFGHAFRMPPLAIQALWPTRSGSGSIASTTAFRHGGCRRKSDKKSTADPVPRFGVPGRAVVGHKEPFASVVNLTFRCCSPFSFRPFAGRRCPSHRPMRTTRPIC